MSLAAALGCQGKADSADPTLPQMIEAREGGSLLASVRPGRPCRATIGPNEMIVGGPPLVSQLGDTRWTGETTKTGTLVSRDNALVARFFPVGDAAAAGIYDPTGVAMERIALEAGKVTVTDASSRITHTLAVKAAGSVANAVAVDDGKTTITGTDDLVLAALIGTTDVAPELRMLAACERVLVQRHKQVP
jgi:hypothetical protein